MWPDAVVTPMMSTGGSDGRFLRLAGMPVYGVSGMFVDIDDNRAHGKDEWIGVREFYEGIDFMYALMKDLASGS
jgi:acetylornithine deacetylase/succinyl-diaminopimelate desuccinylase-like protein